MTDAAEGGTRSVRLRRVNRNLVIPERVCVFNVFYVFLIFSVIRICTNDLWFVCSFFLIMMGRILTNKIVLFI